MKITIDTKDDHHELKKIIQLLQTIVDGSASSYGSSYSRDEDSIPNPFSNASEPSPAPSHGIFNLFNDETPSSLDPPRSEDGTDDEEPTPGIQIVDF